MEKLENKDPEHTNPRRNASASLSFDQWEIPEGCRENTLVRISGKNSSNMGNIDWKMIRIKSISGESIMLYKFIKEEV